MKLLKRIFQRKAKPLLIDNTYRIIPAFELKGTTYYMHENPLSTATGRGLTAMQFIEELIMRCNADYLKYHVEACEKILSDSKKIDLTALMKLNINLKERLTLLTALPDQVYKLASVVYFTKDESPYRYDKEYNKKKIAAWEKADLYDFFLQGQLKTLIPVLALPEGNSKSYLEVSKKINEIHMKDLRDIISKQTSTEGLMS